ncbi:hypothetical protein O181_122797 [Austropuccinia psidii MF-1]|uniref:Uncharacterized protein n=1 Tax=Austropuccinia psidii MF-1 TaxID=1389203 RepID=A0A9Q3KNU6_9BASI|nr:hypothetical protein [Austropuccinia psidii MF-1]
MRPKGAMGEDHQPQGQVGPKPQVGPPAPFLVPKYIQPKMTKKTLSTQNGQKLHGHHFSVHGLWKLPEDANSAPSKVSPHIEGKVSLSSMHPILNVPQVEHI